MRKSIAKPKETISLSGHKPRAALQRCGVAPTKARDKGKAKTVKMNHDLKTDSLTKYKNGKIINNANESGKNVVISPSNDCV